MQIHTQMHTYPHEQTHTQPHTHTHVQVYAQAHTRSECDQPSILGAVVTICGSFASQPSPCAATNDDTHTDKMLYHVKANWF